MTKNLKIRYEYYKSLIKMGDEVTSKEDILFLKKKILEALEDEKEIRESKNVFFDKRANQFSIKIPKSLALKARIDESTIFDFVLKKKNEETLNEMRNSDLVIFVKKNEKEKHRTK